MISILIVDYHRLVRETWVTVLSEDKRFNVIGTCGRQL
jgi:DNA-binding NarL/FixJ family response regulator